MWTEPFDFEGFRVAHVEGVDDDVHVLQAVPLTSPERVLLMDKGFDALTDLLESENASHYDFYRDSVC